MVNSVTLEKCASGCKNKKPEDFTEEHTQFNQKICNWCGHMWVHDCH